ncbi:MAG: hypothetical protein DRP66_01225 [Planctomycetota bacterium]|nr:MAG: hypothetical protein DRP66_01225 [Planctomycetota bacterium]
MSSDNNSFVKVAFSVLVIAFTIILSAELMAVEFDSEDPEDPGDIPYAWIKIGTMASGKLDYDGKVADTDTFIDSGSTIFVGGADADVTLNGNGIVKAYAKKYYHDQAAPMEDFGLADSGGSLGMASQTYKPFTITSDTLADGSTIDLSTNVVYDGLIVLHEKKAGEYSSGQIDFLFEIADDTSGSGAITATNGATVSFEGQLRIQDSFDGTTHTYTNVADMAPETVVNIDFPDEAADNYWDGDGRADLTIVEIDPADLDNFTVLQGSLDVLPAAIKTSITDNNYNAAGNKIYYIIFDKTITYQGEVGKKYYVYMDAHAAAQTSLGDDGAWAGNETLVVCDFSNTVGYDISMSGASGQTTSTISDDEAFGNNGVGTIELSGGALRWNDGVSLAYDFALGAGTTSVMDTQSNSGTIAGDISGTGGLTKEGAGTLTLPAGNTYTYTGATIVSEGGLVVNDSFDSAVTVNDGAWLGGSGGFNAAVTNNGTLKPGNSIGPLVLSGNYVQGSGGQLEIEVADADNNSDTLVVGGDVTLDGTLYVTQTEKITETREYADIVSATGTLSGTFATVTGSTELFYDYTAVVDGKTIDLTVDKTASFSDFAGGATRGVASMLERTYDAESATGQLATVIDSIVSLSSASAVQQAYSELTPGNITNITSTTALNSSGLFSGAIQKHISKARLGNNITVAGLNKPERLLASNSKDAKTYIRHRDYDVPAQGFVKTYASKGDRESDGSQAGYDFEIYGTALGIDKLIDENLLAGIAFGYSNGNVGSSDNLTQNSMETFSTSIYGSWFDLDSYVDVVVGYGHNWYDVSRKISIAGLRASSNPESDVWSTSITAGKAFYLDDTTVEPFAGFSYTLLQSRGYTESGAGNISLSVDRDNVDSINSMLGMRIAKYFVVNEKPLATEFTLAWKHDYSDRIQTSSRFVGSNSAFSTRGLDPLRDSMIAAVSIEANLTENSKLFVKYDTEFNGQFQSHTGQIGVKVTF